MTYTLRQIARMIDGRCPIHGIELTPIKEPIKIKGSKFLLIQEWTPVDCNRKDCDFYGGRFSFDGPVYPADMIKTK
jgi:hypothetical protein